VCLLPVQPAAVALACQQQVAALYGHVSAPCDHTFDVCSKVAQRVCDDAHTWWMSQEVEVAPLHAATTVADTLLSSASAPCTPAVTPTWATPVELREDLTASCEALSAAPVAMALASHIAQAPQPAPLVARLCAACFPPSLDVAVHAYVTATTAADAGGGGGDGATATVVGEGDEQHSHLPQLNAGTVGWLSILRAAVALDTLSDWSETRAHTATFVVTEALAQHTLASMACISPSTLAHTQPESLRTLLRCVRVCWCCSGRVMSPCCHGSRRGRITGLVRCTSPFALVLCVAWVLDTTCIAHINLRCHEQVWLV